MRQNKRAKKRNFKEREKETVDESSKGEESSEAVEITSTQKYVPVFGKTMKPTEKVASIGALQEANVEEVAKRMKTEGSESSDIARELQEQTAENSVTEAKQGKEMNTQNSLACSQSGKEFHLDVEERQTWEKSLDVKRKEMSSLLAEQASSGKADPINEENVKRDKTEENQCPPNGHHDDHCTEECGSEIDIKEPTSDLLTLEALPSEIKIPEVPTKPGSEDGLIVNSTEDDVTVEEKNNLVGISKEEEREEENVVKDMSLNRQKTNPSSLRENTSILESSSDEQEEQVALLHGNCEKNENDACSHQQDQRSTEKPNICEAENKENETKKSDINDMVSGDKNIESTEIGKTMSENDTTSLGEIDNDTECQKIRKNIDTQLKEKLPDQCEEIASKDVVSNLEDFGLKCNGSKADAQDEKVYENHSIVLNAECSRDEKDAFAVTIVKPHLAQKSTSSAEKNAEMTVNQCFVDYDKDDMMTDSQFNMLDDEILKMPVSMEAEMTSKNGRKNKIPQKTLEEYSADGAVLMKGLIDEISGVTKTIVSMKKFIDSLKKQRQTRINTIWKYN